MPVQRKVPVSKILKKDSGFTWQRNYNDMRLDIRNTTLTTKIDKTYYSRPGKGILKTPNTICRMKAEAEMKGKDQMSNFSFSIVEGSRSSEVSLTLPKGLTKTQYTEVVSNLLYQSYSHIQKKILGKKSPELTKTQFVKKMQSKISGRYEEYRKKSRLSEVKIKRTATPKWEKEKVSRHKGYSVTTKINKKYFIDFSSRGAVANRHIVCRVTASISAKKRNVPTFSHNFNIRIPRAANVPSNLRGKFINVTLKVPASVYKREEFFIKAGQAIIDACKHAGELMKVGHQETSVNAMLARISYKYQKEDILPIPEKKVPDHVVGGEVIDMGTKIDSSKMTSEQRRIFLMLIKHQNFVNSLPPKVLRKIE